MNIVCTKNSKHKRFYTTAHIMQEWEVDEQGEFRKVTIDCMEVTHGADYGNIFTCAVCGADAVAAEGLVQALEKADRKKRGKKK